ncbi:hypothetical protein Dimus_033273 [Dionaea muscipula]
MRSRPSFRVCPEQTGICEYIKEVWEESKYTKPLEITRRFANNESIMAARRVKSENQAVSTICPFSRSGGRGEGEDEGNQVDFDREALIDEATAEGESWSWEKFYDVEEDAQGSP